MCAISIAKSHASAVYVSVGGAGQEKLTSGAMATLLLFVALSFLTFSSASAADVHSIDSYGAVANDSSVEAAVKNSRAITNALRNATGGSAVLVPQYSKYYVFASSVNGLEAVELRIEGELLAHDNLTAWPNDGKNYQNMLEFVNCKYILVTGSNTGVIRGQGYKWWVEFLFNFITSTRPTLLEMDNCTNVVIEKLELYNGPRFHIHLANMTDLVVRDIYIWVNVTAQQELSEKKKRRNRAVSDWKVPMFPFNTDGIDPSGRNILIQNITVENYDDVVAVKPGKLLTDGCSENITVENSRVVLGVGMSIGSVPPNDDINCVRNVWFRNIEFEHPFKAIYVKTNSGNSGFGIIDNINYQNITIHSPILWPIYIGPQQQKEPDGGGDGIWPPPQPLVNITNILLQNVTSDGGWLNAGVLRCAASNPCTGITFNEVKVSGWASAFYVCENMRGKVVESSPDPGCFDGENTPTVFHDVL